MKRMIRLPRTAMLLAGAVPLYACRSCPERQRRGTTTITSTLTLRLNWSTGSRTDWNSDFRHVSLQPVRSVTFSQEHLGRHSTVQCAGV